MRTAELFIVIAVVCCEGGQIVIKSSLLSGKMYIVLWLTPEHNMHCDHGGKNDPY